MASSSRINLFYINNTVGFFIFDPPTLPAEVPQRSGSALRLPLNMIEATTNLRGMSYSIAMTKSASLTSLLSTAHQISCLSHSEIPSKNKVY